MRRRIVPILIALLLGALAAWWFDLPSYLGWRAQENGPITLYGNVDIRQVQLGFRVSGRVAEMSFDEGDSIVAYLYLGYPDMGGRPRRRSPAAERTVWHDGRSAARERE